jgi:hypothetical protein
MSYTNRRRAIARAFDSVELSEHPIHYYGGPRDGSFKQFFHGAELPIQKEAFGHYKLVIKMQYRWCDWTPDDGKQLELEFANAALGRK